MAKQSLEQSLFKAADKLRKNIDAADLPKLLNGSVRVQGFGE